MNEFNCKTPKEIAIIHKTFSTRKKNLQRKMMHSPVNQWQKYMPQINRLEIQISTIEMILNIK